MNYFTDKIDAVRRDNAGDNYEKAVAAMEARIHDYLRRKSGISLVELARDVDGFRGEDSWVAPETNVVIWRNMSRAAIAAMLELIRHEK
ncbi:hypothetical protein F4V91_08535 [Neorhizobium galegae]|uniref:Uncharacterized protein n=1 Tax=Neorhizobium galegae TaxID=399 RepID=A0A6A1TNQ9_NEOGA|nr:hypothetical protein [Neorhizobium galegae]KAB1086471.1 hypothetical protein F4V91_08535 [Neorhizobium galegae]